MKSSLQIRLLSAAVPVCLALGLGWAFSASPLGQILKPLQSEFQTSSDSSSEISEQSNPLTVQSGQRVVHVTGADFEDQVLKSNVPVLVDFYADWCGPCQLQDPVLHELAREIDTAKIVKVNIDDNHDLVSRFQVVSIPTLLIFKNGRYVARYTGFTSKKQLKAILARA